MSNRIVKDAIALTVITLISGLLLGLVHDITADPIAKQEAKEKSEAYKAVFADAASFETLTDTEDPDLEAYLDDQGYPGESIIQVMSLVMRLPLPHLKDMAEILNLLWE